MLFINAVVGESNTFTSSKMWQSVIHPGPHSIWTQDEHRESRSPPITPHSPTFPPTATCLHVRGAKADRHAVSLIPKRSTPLGYPHPSLHPYPHPTLACGVRRLRGAAAARKLSGLASPSASLGACSTCLCHSTSRPGLKNRSGAGEGEGEGVTATDCLPWFPTLCFLARLAGEWSKWEQYISHVP